MNGFLRFLLTAKKQHTKHIICKFQLKHLYFVLIYATLRTLFHFLAAIEFLSKKIVLAFNKDYFCLRCFFNSEKLQNLDIAVKLRHFTVDLFNCSYTNICCNRPFFSSSHAAKVAFCFSITSSNDERQSAIFCCSVRQGKYIFIFEKLSLLRISIPPAPAFACNNLLF